MHKHIYLFLFALLLSLDALAAEAFPPAISMYAGMQEIETGMAMLEDRENSLTVDQVAILPPEKFTLLNNTPLRRGFTTDTIWLRLSVKNPSLQPQTRWLELTSPLLEEVHLYEAAIQQSQWHDTLKSLRMRKPVFRLEVAAQGTRTYFLEIRTRTSMSTKIRLWEPEDYLEHETRESMAWNLVFGSYITVLLFYFFFWSWSRERIHLLYALYVSINFLAGFMTEGWPLLLIPPVYKPLYIDILGVMISLALIAASAFTLEYLKAKTNAPRLAKLSLTTASAISLSCLLMLALDHYQWAAITSQISSILFILIYLGLAIGLALKNSRRAKFFILAFTPFYVGVIWRYLRNVNVIEPGFWNDNAYQFGAFFHMALMSAGIFAGYNRLRHERNQAQAQVKAEQALQEQQNDFMAMVSHETRTPLSVILASAENLYLDPSLSQKGQQRTQKIIRAADLIRSLLTRFIERERHLNAHSGYSPSLNDLCSLATNQVQEIQDLYKVQINTEINPSKIEFAFDADLIRIAMANLIENAIFYSGDHANIRLKISADDAKVEILVSDNGPGIPDQDLPYILSRYYRGKNSKGHGLGLHLVNQIAIRHGGALNFQNRSGGGCDVRLTLLIDSHPPVSSA